MSFQYGQNAIELIKQLKRNQGIFEYNDSIIRKVIEEILSINSELNKIYKILEEEKITRNKSISSLINFYIYSTERNIRCLSTFLYHRINRIVYIRWETSSSLIPNQIKPNITKNEIDFYNEYSQILTDYMLDIEFDITSYRKPPKDCNVVVRVLIDCGNISTDNGIINLTKGSTHFLNRNDIEHLIKQGYLEHLTDD